MFFISKKYNYSLYKFLYFNLLGPVLGFFYIFINKYILKYIHKCTLEDKKPNLIILRSYIDFFYSKQRNDLKKLIDIRLFNYTPKYLIEGYKYYHNNFRKRNADDKTVEYIKKKIHLIFQKNKANNFRNLCQLGASGGKDLEYLGKNLNFKKLIYSEIDSSIIDLAKKDYGNTFSYIKASAQEIKIILNNPLFKNDNFKRDFDKDIDIFFSNGSLQYCSPIMLNEFMFQISRAKNKTFLLICEPVELDFLKRGKNFESRKVKAFNYNYNYFVKEAGINILETSIENFNQLQESKYYRNIGFYYLLAQIN